ncbi:MAG: hypothetical protein ACXW3C_07000 [Pyrinomonadaceae bacterium]
MNLYNNTPDELYYSIVSPGSGDCGSIQSQDTTGLSSYDNLETVNVTFSALPASTPPEVTPFAITIPDTGTGMTVTIGIYQE